MRPRNGGPRMSAALSLTRRLEPAPAPRLVAPTRQQLAACHDVLRHGSKSFAAAARLLPRDVRDPATVFYAFCREADDIIDDGADAAHGLAQLSARIDAMYRSRPLHPRDAALAYVVARHQVPRVVFEHLLDGFAWDVRGQTIATTSDLFDYCVRVASTVGVAMCHFMGVRDRVTLARACDLGVAMQLTNIARDIGEDLERGRIYVPRSWLPVGADPVHSLATPSIANDMARRLVALARELYERADAGLDRLPSRHRPSLRAAARIYAAIGDIVVRDEHDVLTTRAVVPAWRKFGLLLGAWTRSRLPRRSDPARRQLELAAPLPQAMCLLPPLPRVGPRKG